MPAETRHALSRQGMPCLCYNRIGGRQYQNSMRQGMPCLYSTVREFSGLNSTSGGQIYENKRFYITLNVEYHSATLWHPPYSEYQQFLFDTIDKMHAEGNSYIKIAQWMNEQGHLTPRGSVFKPNHAWSIHMKKSKSIDRFARIFQPEVTDIGIDII